MMGHGRIAGKPNVTDERMLLHGPKQIENASKGCDKGSIVLGNQRIRRSALVES